MKVRIAGFILYRKYSWEDKPTYTWSEFDTSKYSEYTHMVCPSAIEIDVPDDFDVNDKLIPDARAKLDILKRAYEPAIKKAEEELQALIDAKEKAHAQ